MKDSFSCSKFWVGFLLGVVITAGSIWVVSEVKKSLVSDHRIPNTIGCFEKIGVHHYIFEVDTLTNEVKRIQYFVPMGDPESWERRNSATGRDE